MNCQKLLATKQTRLVFDAVEFPPQHPRDTKLIGDLQLTLLYLPSKFDKDWIYRFWVMPPAKECAPRKVLSAEMTYGHFDRSKYKMDPVQAWDIQLARELHLMVPFMSYKLCTGWILEVWVMTELCQESAFEKSHTCKLHTSNTQINYWYFQGWKIPSPPSCFKVALLFWSLAYMLFKWKQSVWKCIHLWTTTNC